MNNKVKYNRKEYREEYLNSPEWKAIRELIFFEPLECQCCGLRNAKDLHHMVYRNLVDIKISDLLPVCRSCHDFIHKAISDGYIPTHESKIKYITKLTRNILQDDNYEKYSKWLNTKHILSESEVNFIKSSDTVLLRRIRGLIKNGVEFKDLESHMFTGRQIEKIRNFMKTYTYRKEHKMDKGKSQNKTFYNHRHRIRNQPKHL